MDKLTIEEKAKAYDEALERAKKLQETCDSTTVVGWCEYIFPELRESEDELTWLTKYIEEEAYSLSMDIRDNEDRIKLKNLQRSLAWLEKQGEQKPADNFKQKFKVGDWVTNGLCAWRIDSIDEDMYYTNHCGIDCGGDIKSIDEEYHIWTIQDAKDGDVLASELCDSIILFKGINDDNNIDFYCDYDFSKIDVPGDRFTFNNGQHYGNVEDSKDFHPATKEQRDTLIKAMNKAGWEFDFEKKELKKIPNELEEREIVHIEHGKYYYCIKDYYAGGNKRVSKGDVVQALNGMNMMALGVKANKYFMPINNIEQKPADKCEGCNNVKGCVACVDGNAWAHIDEKNSVAWSEEDEVKINRIVACLENLNVADNDILLKDVDWLKSLKQRIGWKPSEEQMEALGIATDINSIPEKYYTELSKLYFDLKKLTE